MKITLKIGFLIALIIFYLVIILSNFFGYEGLDNQYEEDEEGFENEYEIEGFEEEEEGFENEYEIEGFEEEEEGFENEEEEE